MQLFGDSGFSISPFVVQIGVAHETTDTISIYDYENTFDSIVSVHARMQSLWPVDSERSTSASTQAPWP